MKHASIWYGLVCLFVGAGTAELSALSNPFKRSDVTKKIDLSTHWQTLSDAISNYSTDMMKMIDEYATKNKTKMKKQDIEKRFKDIQTAYHDLESSIKSDPNKAKTMQALISQGIAILLKKIDDLKLAESLMLRRSAGLYDQTAASYAANEKKMPVSIRVTAQKVYPFLGVTNDKGRAMSLDDVNNRLKVMRGTMKGDARERDSLFRQLGWYFQSKYSKQEFDAFLKGKEAAKALELPSDAITLLQDRFVEIPKILGMLDEVKHQI